MQDCIFCKIGKKEIPSHVIHETENTLSFLDNKPHAKGHTVVIPKNHSILAIDLNDTQFSNLMLDVRKTMQVLKDKIHPDGFNVGWNSGTAAGQVVPHLHIHILPRYNGDGGGSMHSIINNPQLTPEETIKLFK